VKKSAQSVQAALNAAGLQAEVREMPASTRTAEEAAAAIGCTVDQIAKSIVFQAKDSGAAVMVIAAGGNRVDTTRLAALLGDSVRQASPEFVREATGFVIGGVPPCGHPAKIRSFIDEQLMVHDEVWAAAGTPNAVFGLKTADLPRLCAAEVVDIKVR